MEFSCKSYKDASITALVEQPGIAKGSIYRYFEDKLDLFLYLHLHFNTIKVKYARPVDRIDFALFLTNYHILHEKGISFDLHNGK